MMAQSIIEPDAGHFGLTIPLDFSSIEDVAFLSDDLGVNGIEEHIWELAENRFSSIRTLSILVGSHYGNDNRFF